MTTFKKVNHQIIATEATGQQFNLNHSTVMLHFAVSKELQSVEVLLDRRSLLMRALDGCKTEDMNKGVRREICSIDYLLNLNNPEIADI